MTTLATAPPLSRFLPDEPVAGNYGVAAYPPFSCWQPGQARAAGEVLQQPSPGVPADQPLP
ncbi:MAG: hypothetical protein HY674_05630 [Chloroflexi bacterium]|nr:hypothetical protein [Chloroflexota bacterium]